MKLYPVSWMSHSENSSSEAEALITFTQYVISGVLSMGFFNLEGSVQLSEATEDESNTVSARLPTAPRIPIRIQRFVSLIVIIGINLDNCSRWI